jgi:hypothetical protein
VLATAILAKELFIDLLNAGLVVTLIALVSKAIS